MPRFLLDTNILSDVIRDPRGVVAKRINRLPRSDRRGLCTSIIVGAELRFGAAKKNSPLLLDRIEQLLETITVLPFEADADRHYGRIRAHLESAGLPIGGNDLLIAAHALATGSILVTDNLREFRRVPGLQVQNWLRI